MASTSSSLLRVCVVGGGSISREFALNHFGSATGTVVASVVDINEERAKKLATDVGSVQAGASVKDGGYTSSAAETIGTPVPHATSLEPILSGCDAVYIGTTPGAHAPLVLEALAAGKHVLVEKPLAATKEDADAIVVAAEAASERGQHVGMNIGMRWNPALHELRRLAVTEKSLGALTAARLSLHFKQWPREWQVQPWCAARAEGGPLREVGTHYFFGLMDLFGHGCVRRVQTTVTYPDGIEGTAAESAAEGVLELQDGTPVNLSVRTDATDGDIYELEVVGENGALVLEDFSELRRTAPEAEAGWIVQRGSYGRAESVEAMVAAASASAAASEGTPVDETVAGKAAQAVTARQGRNVQRLLDAILNSGGEWLDVSYD